MTESTSEITGYHAHVYYDAASKTDAEVLRAGIDAKFKTVLGRWHDKPVGPHPHWSYQIAFEPELFAELVPWLALNRRDLNILLHPETGDAIADHSTHAMWLGESVELNLDSLR
ncbi:MAG: DOPA 4,5-dioxygenase family protein [Alphaproteobacteria bacterium]|jgi:aromatic ring-cleaving dioxygenase|nr:DOPA 4,5-dioxygenase family protein [Alphaproteobacteria bacterium]